MKYLILFTALLLIWLAGLVSSRYQTLTVLSQLEVVEPVYDPDNPKPVSARDAFAHFQCARCHAADSFGVSPSLPSNCTGCHSMAIQGVFDQVYSKERVSEWKEELVHLNWAPRLDGIDKRLTRAWILRFLQNPHPIRGKLGAMMPKLPIGQNEAVLLANYLGMKEEVDKISNLDGDAARGAMIYEEKMCGSCHAEEILPMQKLRYGSPILSRLPDPIRRAPDLRHTSQRMSTFQLRNLLEDPRSINSEAIMPNQNLTSSEISDLIMYLRSFSEPPLQIIPRKLNLLDRPIGFHEVQSKLTGSLCFHCHSDSNKKSDKGPGNSGGFGYSGIGLDLATYDGLNRGCRSANGAYLGLPDRMPDGKPRIVASLLARYAEMNGDYSGPVKGMPLGLPPLSEDDIELIWSWIEQGARP